VLADYWTLTKPEVNLLIVITTLAGFCLALPSHLQHFPTWLLANALVGTLLVASGTATLNQFLERDFDAQMRRTGNRPIPAGRIAASNALWFGVLLSCVGCGYLGATVNALASFLALITLLSYLFLYTPLKRKTPLCTLMGVLPGAMPPLIGWAAAAGRLNLEAWTLYAILFLWQFPHFMAIAWIYREDYDRAGYMVLPHGKAGGRSIAVASVLPCVLLLPASLVPMLLWHAHIPYTLAILSFSSGLLFCAVRLALEKSNAVARRLLLASIIYIPLILAFMLFGKQ
jgi:protoheme IX farnesyltransferase